VVALFPAATIGGGLLAARTGGGAAIGAIAGHVSKGMNRGDLKELGERLDAGEYGLVVVAAADVSAKVEQAIANAQAMTSEDLQALEDELDADVKAAEEEEST
jgi:outer membrane lipoprotein SlyB